MAEQKLEVATGYRSWRLGAGLSAVYAALCLPLLFTPAQHPAVAPVIQSLVLAVPLIAMSVIDLREFRLPDVLTVPLIAVGLARTGLADPANALDHVFAAAAGYAAFRAVALAYVRLRGREGLGGGDAKLMSASGAWLGAEGLLASILIGSGTALLAALAASRAGHEVTAQTRIPFGPFLALGIWLTWLYGPLI